MQIQIFACLKYKLPLVVQRMFTILFVTTLNMKCSFEYYAYVEFPTIDVPLILHIVSIDIFILFYLELCWINHL